MSDDIHLMVVQGETFSLKATTTEEMMKRLDIKQSGDSLKLKLKHEKRGWFSWGSEKSEDRVYLEVQMSDLKQLKVSGSTQVIVGNMRLGDLQLKISGASKLAVEKISLNNLNAEISGASKKNLPRLMQKQ